MLPLLTNFVIYCQRFSGFLITLLFLFINSPSVSGTGRATENQGFYILKIEDHRAVKPRILHGAASASSLSFTQLPAGEFQAIQKVLVSNSNPDKKLRPVIISIKETQIVERNLNNGRIEGKVNVKLNFQLAKGAERINLVDYEGGALYTRSISNPSVPAAALNRTLEAGLKYLAGWMIREAPRNIKLATGLKFHFDDYLVQHADTVYYSPERPLKWSDFKDSPKSNGFGAEVFAGFGFDQYSKIENGVVHVSVLTKVFVPKSASWVRPDNLNSYALNHEQRHFDIAKIIAERFKQQILEANLTLDNYEGFLGPHYLETLRAMNRMQEQYDRESRHGMDKIKQEAWNNKIDAELTRYGFIQ